MGFVSGNVVSSTPAQALINALDAELVATGWTFVKQIDGPAQAGGMHTRVWKCPAALNFFGSDFHLRIRWSVLESSISDLAVYGSEGFDSATDQISRPCAGANKTIDADHSQGSGTLYSLQEGKNATLKTQQAGYDYFIRVFTYGVWIGTKYGSTDSSAFLGLFDSTMAADPFPLILTGANLSDTLPSSSRHPNRGPFTNNFDNFEFYSASLTWTSGTLSEVDPNFGYATATPVRLHTSGSGAATADDWGWIRGVLRDTVTVDEGAAVPRPGDYLVIDGRRWHYYPGHFAFDGYWVDSGLAA